jgi:DNA-binding CsgD family transcriptional regulator
MPDAPDRAELLAALRFIGAAQNLDDFALRTCQELLRLVPGIRSSYNELNTASHRVAALVYPDPGREFYEQYAPLFQRHMFDSPVVRYFEEFGQGDVVSWTDVDPDGAFLETELYHRFYEPYGIASQIVLMLPVPPGMHIVLAVNRDGSEFTPRERALLEELRLHLVNLYRLVSYAEASLQRGAAVADAGWSVILVDDFGTVLESNEVAISIGKAAGVDLDVGGSLAGSPLWSVIVEQHLDLWARSQPSLVRSGGAPFEARLLHSAVGPHVLWIREPSRVTAQDAIGLGLTARQAQIALLLVDGLTNSQIGRRVGISSGTVRKHLEAMYQRLGVPSRAAAVGRLQARAAPRSP